ncbi:MAG: GNAT family N-acetyltransferase [Pirellulales bacterium]|nr:GNAT family N-acetyltransferase [Pirellulales bacterium]
MMNPLSGGATSTGTTQTRIVAASAADAEEILALQRIAYQSEAAIYPGCYLPPLVESLDDVRTQCASMTVLKALAGGRIVGSVRAAAQNGTCHICRLIVHPDHQNRGLGARLMRTVEASFPEVKRFELFTGHKSQRNLRLYAKLGYQIFKTTPRCPELLLVYLEKPAAARQ